MDKQTLAKCQELKMLIRNPYAWPGGYPRYAVLEDGAALCVKCCTDEYKLILGHTRTPSTRSGWEYAGADINWEDPELHCDHCGNRIESAYAEDEAVSA
jgi:hypothetical protein